jgi:hypothetical protein
MADWYRHCAYNAEQRAAEYWRKADAAEENPGAFKRVSTRAKQAERIAQQDALIAQLVAQVQLLVGATAAPAAPADGADGAEGAQPQS